LIRDTAPETSEGAAGPDTITSVATLVKGLATGVRAARLVAAE
jgi:tryptophan synthase alpha chain